MRSSLSTALAGAAIFAGAQVAAQNSSSKVPTVNMFINDALDGDAAYAASIVEACSDQTVYAIHCTSAPSDVGTETCGPDAPILTVTEGPSTYQAVFTTSTAYAGHEVEAKISEGCVLSGTATASCEAEVSLSMDGSSTKTATTSLITGTEYHRFDVAITGGAEKTASATGACSVKSGAMSMKNTRGGITTFGAVLAAGIVGLVAL